MNPTLLVVVVYLYSVLIHLSTSKKYPDVWDEYPKLDFMDAEATKDVQKGRCKDGRCSPKYDFFDITRRSPSRLLLDGKKYKKAQTSYLPTCSCGMEQSVLDLGSHYYPRYLLTATCKGESCWMGPYKCKPTPYEVKVLKKKVSEEEIFNSSLSTSLKEEWVAEVFTVTVACECSP